MRSTALRPGFTLIELIVVIAIIAIIITSVFVAIDPARRLHAARNARRWTDARAILEAVKNYQADHEGDLPASVQAIDADPATVQMIGVGGVACNAVAGYCSGVTFPGAGCFASGLGTDLAKYLKSMPEDPKSGSSGITGYFINEDTNGFIVVGSCNEEGEGFGGIGSEPTIEVQR